MKLDGFALNNTSHFSVYNTLKLKSFHRMKITSYMKSILGVLAFLVFSFSLNGQSNSNNTSVVSEVNEATTLLLKELERKVTLFSNKQNDLLSKDLNSNQKEKNIYDLENQKNDIISYIALSLEDICTLENRLNELAQIVKLFDPKLSRKFEILHKENQQNLR
jgi:hypothetical protein